MSLFEELYQLASSDSHTWEEASQELRDLNALAEAYYDALLEEEEGDVTDPAILKQIAIELSVQLFYVGRRYEEASDLVPLVLSKKAVQGLMERMLKE